MQFSQWCYGRLLWLKGAGETVGPGSLESGPESSLYGETIERQATLIQTRARLHLLRGTDLQLLNLLCEEAPERQQGIRGQVETALEGTEYSVVWSESGMRLVPDSLSDLGSAAEVLQHDGIRHELFERYGLAAVISAAFYLAARGDVRQAGPDASPAVARSSRAVPPHTSLQEHDGVSREALPHTATASDLRFDSIVNKTRDHPLLFGEWYSRSLDDRIEVIQSQGFRPPFRGLATERQNWQQHVGEVLELQRALRSRPMTPAESSGIRQHLFDAQGRLILLLRNVAGNLGKLERALSESWYWKYGIHADVEFSLDSLSCRMTFNNGVPYARKTLTKLGQSLADVHVTFDDQSGSATIQFPPDPASGASDVDCLKHLWKAFDAWSMAREAELQAGRRLPEFDLAAKQMPGHQAFQDPAWRKVLGTEKAMDAEMVRVNPELYIERARELEAYELLDAQRFELPAEPDEAEGDDDREAA